MNTIIKIETKIPLTLVCTFDNGIVKHINLQSITHLPVFSFLKKVFENPSFASLAAFFKKIFKERKQFLRLVVHF